MDRKELITRLRDVFEARGFEGATLTEIARASGLSKASLYHHFPDGKTGMGLALLKDAGIRLEQTTLAPLRGGAAPEARLAAMIDGVRTYYDEGRRSCLLTVFALGPPAPHFDDLVKARLEEWIDLLGATLQDAGLPRKDARRLARDAVARIQGAAVLARALGDAKPFRQVLKRLAPELAAAAGRSAPPT
ncbi:MAG TPA: TetR/AcrR family transcriptional regulator [Pseudomonadales bacterium]|nr:TetR/AcrR family transcriptional regulator [Pseudomonadales bacterium]